MTIPKYFVRVDAVNYNLASFTFTREGNSAVDETKFSVARENSELIGIGNDVQIGFVDGGFQTTFAGDIIDKSKHEIAQYTMQSYGGRLTRAIATEIYADKTPEFIAEDLITIYLPSLTYASTAVSGKTIPEFIVDDELVSDAIGRLAKLLGWQLRTDNNKNFFFEPVGTVINANPINIPGNGAVTGLWKDIPNNLVNRVIFKGGVQTFTTTDPDFTATGGQTDFVLLNEPTGNVVVTVDGTEKVGGVDETTSPFDYTVDSPNKKIIFESGLSGGETVIITYQYEITVKIDSSNQDSITEFGIFPQKLTDTTVITMSDARKRVQTILATFSSVSKTNNIIVNYGSDYDAGETVTVVDAFNDINQQLVISKLKLTYPDGKKTLTVGTPLFNSLDWNTSLDSRLKALEQSQNSGNVIQKYSSIKENILVTQRQGRVRTRTQTIGNSWIVGSSTNGLVGTNTATQGGGQQVVGSDGRGAFIISSISNYLDVFRERFNFTTYIDTGNTTATVDTTNEDVDFTTGEILTSLECYKGTTVLTKAILTVDDDTNLTFEARLDGVNWETVASGVEFTFANTGTTLEYRATASGNATISLLTIDYN